MAIALVVGLQPNKTKRGPNVQIGSGNWAVLFEGVKNSKLALELHPDPPRPIEHGEELKLDAKKTVTLHVLEAGTESTINVLCEYLGAIETN